MTKNNRKKTSGRTKSAGNKSPRGLPTQNQIIEFITQNPKNTSKRDIARHFGIKGNARVELKTLLRDMLEAGALQKRGKRLVKPGSLPSVTTLDIVTRDRNGGLLAIPTNWNEQEDGNAPAVSIIAQKDRGKKAGIGDRVLARILNESDASGGSMYRARIMKLLSNKRSSILGILREHGDNYRLEPADRKQSEVDIPAEAAGGGEAGDLVEVETGRGRKYGLKIGKVVNVIGSYNSEQALSMIAIHDHDIPHVFPQPVLDDAENQTILTAENMQDSREDWRELPLITIDPADAKDHDDAIYAEPDNAENNPGGHIVYVAIADVSWYVRPSSLLDQEALKRGNSVYFPDRVVPMLPERISNDLCSLRENVDRPALAVRMIFEASGRKRSHTFHRILMRSPAKLAYQQAQAAIDGAPDNKTSELLGTVLEPLWDAYRCLSKGRNEREPLDINVPERKIILKNDGTVDRVIVPDRLDAHKLVEEFMIQANVAAAQSLERAKQVLIYRIHDAPSMAKLESYRDFLKTLDLSLASSGNLRPAHFNGILNAVRDTDNYELVNQVTLRSQSQAEYSPENIGHFGLNLTKYTHFTSPIRRYADLIVHRALVGALKLGAGGITRDEEATLDVVSADISTTERRAAQAERDTIDRLISSFLSQSIGERFIARINGVTKAGLFVTLADTGADGFIPISTISDEYLIFDPSSHSIIGENSGLAYQMGQTVEVRLLEAAPVAGALLFEMLSEGKKTGRLPRSRRSNSRPRQAKRNFGGRKKRRR